MSEELRRLSKELGGIPKDLRKRLRTDIKKAAKPVHDQAKHNARWSKRIPRATRIAVRFAKRDPHAAITTSHKRAPHAHAYENKGKQGEFRHPVHANPRKPRTEWTWVSQKARPFLSPALALKQEAVVNEIGRTVDETTRAAGFR
jgi:hypothetical protein